MAGTQVIGGAKVMGVDRIAALITQMTIKGKKFNTIGVGYGGPTAPYAIYVHEDATKLHPIGNYKFLERPFRMHRIQMTNIIMDELKNHRSLDKALTEGANFLLYKSLPQVPYDTGALRNSHFVDWGRLIVAGGNTP